MKASQGKVARLVRAASGKRDDVIYGESYILPSL